MRKIPNGESGLEVIRICDIGDRPMIECKDGQLGNCNLGPIANAFFGHKLCNDDNDDDDLYMIGAVKQTDRLY